MFKINARSLTVALMRGLPVVGSVKSGVPILARVRLRVADGVLTISATNLDIQLDVDADIEVFGGNHAGAIAIDPRRMLAILRLLPRADAVTVERDGEGVVMTWNGGRCRLPGLPASDMPDMTPGEAIVRAVMGSAENDALRRVAPFVSLDETRYYLNGVCLFDGKMVATDGHRLAALPGGEALAGLCAPFAGKTWPIVPADVVSLWLRMAERGDVDAALCGGSEGGVARYITLAGDGVRLTAKLIDAPFPDWRRVVPDRSAMTPVEVSRGQLMRACTLVATIGDRHAYATLVFADGRGQLQAKSLECGEIAADFGPAPGLSAIVGVNGHYLRGALECARGKNATLWIPPEGGLPLIVDGGEAGDGEQILVMPIRSLERVSFAAPELVLAA